MKKNAPLLHAGVALWARVSGLEEPATEHELIAMASACAAASGLGAEDTAALQVAALFWCSDVRYDPPRHWLTIEPLHAIGLSLSTRPDITAPLNEAGERCPWPWDPQLLEGEPIGQYHCPYCGAMVLAGIQHVDYTELLSFAHHLPPPGITAAEFEQRFGRPPQQDDLHRANCEHLGEVGHAGCGVCRHNRLTFECAECFEEASR